MSQAAVAQLFKALGDPVRLQIVQRLSNGGALAQGRDFITSLEAQWDQRLQALKQFVEQ